MRVWFHSRKASGVNPTYFCRYGALYFLGCSYLKHRFYFYPKPVSKDIANTSNCKTTHYSWLKQLLNPLLWPFHLYGGNLMPTQLTAIALFQHIYPFNFSRSLEISLNFFSEFNRPTCNWIMYKKYIAIGSIDKVLVDYVVPNPELISSLLL